MSVPVKRLMQIGAEGGSLSVYWPQRKIRQILGLSVSRLS